MNKPMQAPKMSPDESAASLAFATRLSEGLLPQQPQEAPQSSQNAPEPQEAPQPDMEGLMAKMELNMTKKLDDMRKEIKDDLRKDIQDALANENDQKG